MLLLFTSHTWYCMYSSACISMMLKAISHSCMGFNVCISIWVHIHTHTTEIQTLKQYHFQQHSLQLICQCRHLPLWNPYPREWCIHRQVHTMYTQDLHNSAYQINFASLLLSLLPPAHTHLISAYIKLFHSSFLLQCFHLILFKCPYIFLPLSPLHLHSLYSATSLPSARGLRGACAGQHVIDHGQYTVLPELRFLLLQGLHT